jgi:hypothetical protein
MRVDGSLCLEGRRPRRPRGGAEYDEGSGLEWTIRAMYDFGVGIAIAIGIDVVRLFTHFPAWQ